MKTSVKVEGLSELGEQLRALGLQTEAKVLRGALREAVVPIAEEARRLAPRGDSPDGLHLADAIAVSAPKPSGKNGAVAGIKMVSKNIEVGDDELEAMFGQSLRFKLPGWRWHFAEFGTRHHAAQPFLRPAFDAKAPEALKVFVEAMRKRIASVKKRMARAAK